MRTILHDIHRKDDVKLRLESSYDMILSISSSLPASAYCTYGKSNSYSKLHCVTSVRHSALNFTVDLPM